MTENNNGRPTLKLNIGVNKAERTFFDEKKSSESDVPKQVSTQNSVNLENNDNKVKMRDSRPEQNNTRTSNNYSNNYNNNYSRRQDDARRDFDNRRGDRLNKAEEDRRLEAIINSRNKGVSDVYSLHNTNSLTNNAFKMRGERLDEPVATRAETAEKLGTANKLMTQQSSANQATINQTIGEKKNSQQIYKTDSSISQKELDKKTSGQENLKETATDLIGKVEIKPQQDKVMFTPQHIVEKKNKDLIVKRQSMQPIAKPRLFPKATTVPGKEIEDSADTQEKAEKINEKNVEEIGSDKTTFSENSSITENATSSEEKPNREGDLIHTNRKATEFNHDDFVKKDDNGAGFFRLIKTDNDVVQGYRSNIDAEFILANRRESIVSDNEEVERARIANFRDRRKNTSLRSGIVGISSDDSDIHGGVTRRFVRKSKPRNRNIRNEDKKVIVQEVIIDGPVSIKGLAKSINVKAIDIIKFIHRIEKKRFNEEHSLSPDTAELIVLEYGHKPILKTFRTISSLIMEQLKKNKNLKKRPPVVTIMGHVDHGKTSLLDAFRSSRIVDQESGGITQHVGAYQITTSSGEKISFIDTPGHEAFTAIRARGSQVTDIVILVVAADDGIMPQTVESINHIRASGVPMIVAVNKIDKTDGDIRNILNQLLQYDVVVEQLGGEIMAVGISAKNKTNLDKLEESILLQAEILELTADFTVNANGVIIESKINNIKGHCATLLVQNGLLKIGDCLISGTEFCRVRSMFDEFGKRVDSAEPSIAVEVFGFQTAPEVGQKFLVVNSEKEAKAILAEFAEIEEKRKNLEEGQKDNTFNVNSLFETSNNKEDKQKELKFIVKADVSGTIEAVQYSLNKLNSEKLKITLIHSGTGCVNESDIDLAKTTNSVVACFNVSTPSAIESLARKEHIMIRSYDIIYKLIDDVQDMIDNKLKPQKIEVYIGRLIVKQVFDIGGTGKIAGCLVDDNHVVSSGLLRIKRKGTIVKEGVKISVLKRFKEDVQEVKKGLECGLAAENFDDIMQGDIIEVYKIVANK